MEMSELEKVWLACAIDAEGVISIKRVGKQYTSYINVSNNDVRFVEKPHHITGKGHVVVNKKQGKTKNNREFNFNFVWQVTKASDCYEILNQIYPYLLIKKDRAERVLLYLKFRRQKGKGTHYGIEEHILVKGNSSEIKNIEELM